MAKEYQATEKARRAKEHNEALGQQERESLPSPSCQMGPNEIPPRSLFAPGSRVWLYMERVKPGLTKKLAHRWHGPFRIKKKVEDFAYDLELPNRSGYSFYPVVRVSWLKAVSEFGDRPKGRLTGCERGVAGRL
ncbi:hypothetical protein PF003_g22048 [Phytophthora fragariae]|nr:hypothetical protein PF003_g22048 [Phytophthora fragariae]